MKTLGIVTWFVISALVTALIESWALHTLWRWFLSAQYGTGPSFGAWFGITAITGLVVGTTITNASLAKNDEEWDAKKAVAKTIGTWLGILALLGISWAIGSAIGWIS